VLRNCYKIPVDKLIVEFDIRTVYKVSLFIDELNSEKIKIVIADNKDRFRRAVYEILMGRYNNDLYGKEKVSGKTVNITAIKFKRRNNSNIRIYCKEYIDSQIPNVKSVVMICTYDKRTQKIDKKLRSFINRISGYEYEI